MIGVSNPLPPCCSSCGDEHPVESMQLYRYELICPTCYEDHEAKTEQANAVEFRLLSREWLKKGTYLCDDCGICPDQLIEQCCGDRVCGKCEERRNDDAAERQEEANCEAYYGGECSADVYERASQRAFNRRYPNA